MGKGIVKAIAGIITVLIGGTVYTVSKGDVVKNFSADTGMSQSEAENYIENIPNDELVSFKEVGLGLIDEGQEILSIASELDCDNYLYDWQTDTLTCEEGKSQLIKFGESEIALGNAYKVLETESASSADISSTIELINKVNENYNLELIRVLLDYSDIDEALKTNLYNKAVLQAVLDSN